VVRVLLALTSVALAACSDSPLPGTMLGTYKVTGTSTTNTCGLGAPDPWQFDVEISQSSSTVYWSWLDGSPLLNGTMAGSTASFAVTGTVNADSTDAGLGPCNLTRADSLTIAFAPGSPPPTFGGTIAYSYTVPSGSSCTDQLAASGGMFTSLPCSVSYTVTAAHQ
jgi:hypothetical protein